MSLYIHTADADATGVNTPVGSRDPVYNFLCWQLTSDDIMTSYGHCWKICKNSRILGGPTLHSRFECLQTCSIICYVISYFYSIGYRIVNLVTAIAESVGSRRELVANSCTHRRRRRDATKQFRRVGVGGVYWALRYRYLVTLSGLLAVIKLSECRPTLHPYTVSQKHTTVLLTMSSPNIDQL